MNLILKDSVRSIWLLIGDHKYRWVERWNRRAACVALPAPWPARLASLKQLSLPAAIPQHIPLMEAHCALTAPSEYFISPPLRLTGSKRSWGGEREERSSAPSKAKYVLVLSLFHENRKADIKTVMEFLLFILIKQTTTWFWLLIKQCWCSQWSIQQWYSWVTKTYKELRRVKAAESMLRLRIV